MADEVDGGQKKPFKVCRPDRKLKGVVASSLIELKHKACKSLEIDLNLANNIRTLLEEDGTEIDDEEYFDFLPSQTKIMILTEKEIVNLGKFL